MCAIFGEIMVNHDKQWMKEQKEKALKRGKDLIEYGGFGYQLFHTRLATNNSIDIYPIFMNNLAFAMNGIVNEARYKKLLKRYVISPYTSDSACMLAMWTEMPNDFEQYDDLDFVFAFWLVDGNKIYLANKDFPLYIKPEGEGLRFSSFNFDGAEPLGNRAIVFDATNNVKEHLYDFKNLVYASVKDNKKENLRVQQNKNNLSKTSH